MDEYVRHALWMELRHLQCQLRASAFGAVVGLFERAWSRGREAALGSFALRLAVEALREDLRQLLAASAAKRRAP